MSRLRTHYERTVDEVTADNARDLEIAYAALGRIEGRKRFTPDEIMGRVFTTVDMVVEDPIGAPQNVCVCKIVVPTEALPALYEAIGKHLPPAETQGSAR
jgi:hypothetical protein